MRVAIIAPNWGNSWLPIYKELFEERGHDVFICDPDRDGFASDCDVALHMWAVAPYGFRWSKHNIIFMRRYELFEGQWTQFDWSKVSSMIFCNSWIKWIVDEYLRKKSIYQDTRLILNAVDTRSWTFREQKPGNKIGMVCHVHPKKNIPMALQILAKLPDQYELHIAGAVQDSCTAEYLNFLAQRMKRRIYFYGQLPREELDAWWDQMNFCLSTSISEGNPNNVLEAMAKGIKPVVHAWPGAEVQFEPWVFNTVDEAADMIRSEDYKSSDYLDHAVKHHSLDNYKKVVDLAEELCTT